MRRRIFWGALLFVAAAVPACAKIEAPTGGPRDLTPPHILSVTPDTFAILEAGEHEIKFEFSERISQKPFGGGTLDQAVQVSPQTGEVEVKHGRRSIEVKMKGGFLPGRVYRITVLPVIQDMFQNPLRNPFELLVSTGPAFEPTVLAAEILDWMTGDPVDQATLEARPDGEAADTFPYLAVADEEGVAIFRYLPSGSYQVQAYSDLRRNSRPDYTEPQARITTTVAGSDTTVLKLQLLLPDTIPARVMRVDVVDSVNLRVTVDDLIAPDSGLANVRMELEQDNGDAWEVLGPITEADWAAAQAAADSVAVQAAADSAALVAAALADTIGAGADPPVIDPPVVVLPAPDPQVEDEPIRGNGAGLVRSFVVRLANPLRAGEEYLLRVTGVMNLNGVPDGGGEGIFAAPDTIGVRPGPRDPSRSPVGLEGAGSPDGTPPSIEGYLPCSDWAQRSPDTARSHGSKRCRSH